jgi:hypothetical protein
MSKINEDILRRKFSRQYALDLSHILSVDLIDSEYVHYVGRTSKQAM